MRSRIVISSIVLMALFSGLVLTAQAQIIPSLGGDRSGTSGFQFLKIPVDARSAALGESVVATTKDLSALYWNPALVSHLPGIQAGFQHTAYFVDIQMEYAGVSYQIPGSNMALGFSVQTLNSGEMKVTTEFQPFGTGETFRLVDLAAGLTFSQQLTDLFSYGVTSKYIRESVAGISAGTLAFDLGIHYSVGSTGAQMGVSVRNFGIDGTPEGELERTIISDPSLSIESDFESMTPPTTFHMAFSYLMLKQSDGNSLTVSTQLNNPNDNAENWNVGVEYGWQELLYLRSGYRFGIEEATTPSFGIGLATPLSLADFRFDYAFNRLERLGSVHRIGMQIGL